MEAMTIHMSEQGLHRLNNTGAGKDASYERNCRGHHNLSASQIHINFWELTTILSIPDLFSGSGSNGIEG